MIFKRRLYIWVIVLALVFFATVMIAFMANRDNTEDFKGTLVNGWGQEAVI